MYRVNLISTSVREKGENGGERVVGECVEREEDQLITVWSFKCLCMCVCLQLSHSHVLYYSHVQLQSYYGEA